MKNLLLLTSFLWLNLVSAQQREFHDFVHNTSVSYHIVPMQIESKLIGYPISLERIHLDKSSFSKAIRINELIEKNIQRIISEKFANEFQANFKTLVGQKLQKDREDCIAEVKARSLEGINCEYILSTGEEYKLETDDIAHNIVALCDDILITSLSIYYEVDHEVEYNREYNMIYSEMHYYDLSKGIEIDPNSILISSKKNAFEKVVRKYLPPSLNPSNLDLSYGQPIFFGTGFYYNLVGSNGTNYPTPGYQIQIRIPLEEVVPFLNKKGPFASYINVKPSTSESSQLAYSTIHHNDPYITRHVDALNSLERFLTSLSGPQFKNQLLSAKKESFQASFNENGQITCYWFVDQDENRASDSVTFDYHSNKALRAIHRYELFDYEDDETEEEFFHMKETETFIFDQNENLIEYHEVDDQAYFRNEPYPEIESLYLTYLGDRVFIEEYYQDENQFDSGYPETFTVKAGELIQMKNPSYSNFWKHHLQQTETLVQLTRTTEKKEYEEFSVILESGQPIKKLEHNGQRMIEYTYDSKEHPTTLKHYNQTGDSYSLHHTIEVKYDTNGRPVSYSRIRPTGSVHTWEFEYRQIK